jgi:hypothetical protein
VRRVCCCARGSAVHGVSPAAARVCPTRPARPGRGPHCHYVPLRDCGARTAILVDLCSLVVTHCPLSRVPVGSPRRASVHFRAIPEPFPWIRQVNRPLRRVRGSTTPPASRQSDSFFVRFLLASANWWRTSYQISLPTWAVGPGDNRAVIGGCPLLEYMEKKEAYPASAICFNHGGGADCATRS